VRAIHLAILATAVATPMQAQSLQVVGYAGYLGEWELTANVVGKASDGMMEYSGPLALKHVGVCSQDGPEEKSGEMRFRLSSSSSHIRATLLVEGAECIYSGERSDAYFGTMRCADRPDLPLRLWVRAADAATDATNRGATDPAALPDRAEMTR